MKKKYVTEEDLTHFLKAMVKVDEDMVNRLDNINTKLDTFIKLTTSLLLECRKKATKKIK